MTAHRSEVTDPDVLGGHEEHVLLRAAPWRRFAVLGDSIAAGIGDPVPGYLALTWPQRVARALRTRQPELAYRNLGVRDRLAAEVRATQLEPALAFAPDLAAVLAGGNDALRGRFDAGTVEAELDAIVGALRAAGADVLLYTLLDVTRAVALPEPHAGRLSERLVVLGAATAAVAARHGALLVDCNAHPRVSDRSLYSADLLHLNHRGQAVVASETVRALARALVRTRAPA